MSGSAPEPMPARTNSTVVIDDGATTRVARPAPRITTVRGRRDVNRFISLPWRIYRDDPCWVPPLRVDVKALFDRAKHPFHEHADVEFFLAWRGDEPVGRIAAVINHAHDAFHAERAGFFGLFECADDQDVATLLLATAEQWLHARGATFARGPMNLSTNDELCSPGVLIAGFDRAPTIMMAHTPPYYAALLEGAGYGKAKDLLAFWRDAAPPPAALRRALTRLQRNTRVRIRAVDLRRFDEELQRVQQIYNSAWERNWGFVPLSDAEIRHVANNLRPVINPRLCLFAEVDGEAVGFALGLPDYNQALRHANGRLFPFGLFKLLWYRRRIDAARVITLGLRPEHRHKGLDALLILKLFEAGPQVGMPRGECSWILENNLDMQRSIERTGAHLYKTYRIFEKPLSS